MRKRLRASTIAVSLLVAAPVVGVAYSAYMQATFKDIPAGHWAQEAVSYITQQGLIQGYPDQTFRGSRNLTRYEAAQIFYRLLRSGAMNNMSGQGQTTVQAGMTEVQAELDQIKTANADTTTRLTALEDQVKTLGASPAAPAASPELEARVKALEDKATAAPAAPGADLDARVKALEDKVSAIPASPAAPATDTALEARVKALEDKAAAAPATGAAPTVDLTPLEARVKALEDKAAAPATGGTPATSAADPGQDTKIAALQTQVKDLTDQLNALSNRVASTPAAPPAAPPPPPAVVVTPPPAPTPPVDLAPPPPPPPPAVRNFFVGVGGASTVFPFPSDFGLASNGPVGIFGQIGFKNLLGPVGLRIVGDLSRIPTAGAELLLGINNAGVFNPYIGLGGGAQFDAATSFYVGGSLGVNFNFSPAIALFLEASPRYNLSASAFDVKARFGIRLSL